MASSSESKNSTVTKDYHAQLVDQTVGLERLADITGLTVEVLAAAREEALVMLEAEKEVADEKASKKEKEARAKQPKADPKADLVAAAKLLLEQGYELVDGQLRPPKIVDDAYVIEVLQQTTYRGVGYRDREVTIPVPASIYRGAMARKLVSLLKKSEYKIISGE